MCIREKILKVSKKLAKNFPAVIYKNSTYIKQSFLHQGTNLQIYVGKNMYNRCALEMMNKFKKWEVNYQKYQTTLYLSDKNFKIVIHQIFHNPNLFCFQVGRKVAQERI